MNVVHMNGIALLPGVDYTVGDALVSFSQAPERGARIMFTEVIDPDTGATHVTQIIGDGHTYLFHLETNFGDRVKLQRLFESALTYKDHPTVRDVLERLQVVVELVKHDATIYKR